MRKVVALIALVTFALCAATARANLSVGINDDAGVESASASWFFPTMRSEGLSVDTVTLRWDEGAPTTISPSDVAAVNAVVSAAQVAGVTVELDLYPLHSTALTDGTRCRAASSPLQCGDSVRIRRFAAWTAQVAQTFPAVHDFVVMNECNQPYFVNPQWTLAGTNESAEICGRALVAAYDALHAVSAQNTVWGVGLSPRGNDDPNAASNSSTSPVKFLAALGAWFRAYAAQTHRTAPLMDGLDIHPYPVPQSLPFATGYSNANDASVGNLPRLYAAFYSAFSGTPQPTIGQQTGGGLPVSVNEVGIQTSSAGLSGYHGVKLAANAAGGVFGRYATQAYQAQWYGQMLDLLACDPNVRVVNIFKLVDEPDLGGWQSGLYQFSANGTPAPKQSAQTVRSWIASTGGACRGSLHPWSPPSPKPVVTPPQPAPPAVPSGNPFTSGERGWDVSWPNCFLTLPQTGFLVVGVTGGQPFTANPCFRKEAATGIAGVYVNTGYTKRWLERTTRACANLGAAQDTPLATRRAYALGCSEASYAFTLATPVKPSMYWLDVERSNPWSVSPTLNRAVLRGMLDFLGSRKPTPLIGVYSAPSWWRGITGGWQLALPEWTPTAVSGAASCAQGFSTGPVWLTQGGSSRIDVDRAC